MRHDLSDEGARLIQHFESCRLVAYPDPGTGGDPWTIGWGHTGSEVCTGLVIDQAEADRLFRQDVFQFVQDVNNLLGGVGATQSEFDALVSFAYNVGPDIDADDIAEGLGDSTLLRKFKAGDIQGAANEFPKWNKAKGNVLAGLTRRRKAERAMFLGQDWRAAAGIL
jgi:lysozyme